MSKIRRQTHAAYAGLFFFEHLTFKAAKNTLICLLVRPGSSVGYDAAMRSAPWQWGVGLLCHGQDGWRCVRLEA